MVQDPRLIRNPHETLYTHACLQRGENAPEGDRPAAYDRLSDRGRVRLVNDGSTDETAAILDRIADKRAMVFHQPTNRGKGAAIRKAAELATGDYVIMCDADEEYRPQEIPTLMQPVLEGEAKVIYGTRTFGSHTSFSFWYVIGNKGVSLVANILFNSYISDVETCFKLMPLRLYRSLKINPTGSAWKQR